MRYPISVLTVFLAVASAAQTAAKPAADVLAAAPLFDYDATQPLKCRNRSSFDPMIGICSERSNFTR